MLEEADELLLRPPARMAERKLLGRRVVAELEPLIADQQHRLREVERGESRVERHGQHRIGERDMVVDEARCARDRRGCRTPRPRRRSRASRPSPGAASRCASPCSGRAPSWRRRASDRRSPAPTVSKSRRALEHDIGAARRRLRCALGQPSRGLTRRRSVRPQLSMARAAVPMFSPSCGSTRMMAGPPVSAVRR